MKVAIVHDWLVGGGAELVVEQLHKIYPEAPIYTSYATKEWKDRLDNKVVTGYLQYWPFSKLRKFLPPLRILWFTHLDFSDFDIVISSSGNGEAKGIKVPSSTKHVCYCHSPTHFYWRHYEQYISEPGFGIFNPVARIGLRLLASPLRKWDKKAAQRPDSLIANSAHIQSDIKKYYNRESTVIHPPVDTHRFSKPTGTTRKGFVTVGRQVPYKKVDLIVNACTEIDLPLTVIGRGPQHSDLVRRAGSSVKFLVNASDEEVTRQLKNAEAFIIAAFEDFGITPVEALAAGTPVIAYRAGGALDYVMPGKTGEFFDKQTAHSLSATLKKFSPGNYSETTIKKFAEAFDEALFREKIKKYIDEVVK